MLCFEMFADRVQLKIVNKQPELYHTFYLVLFALVAKKKAAANSTASQFAGIKEHECCEFN